MKSSSQLKTLFTRSRTIVIIGCFLSLMMIRLSYWQWERHLEKKVIIQTLEARLEQPPVAFEDMLAEQNKGWDDYVHRRVMLSGTFDYDHEVVLRNRRLNGLAGVHILTPFKIDATNDWLLVSRGFIPLNASTPQKRKQFRGEKHTTLIGLIKEGAHRRSLAPADPSSGPQKTWVDAWLRVDIAGIARQLPYPLLPLWAEKMDDKSLKEIRESIVKSSEGRSEILSLATRAVVTAPKSPGEGFPIPVYDIIIPPGRHMGYVFEWALMALGTLLGTFILQLKRR
jgi:cytochrome oxidase assembly protein ShyY1